jgi:ubiquinone biosynthesis protein COQ4
MGYENLQPALERIKLTAGFIAQGGVNTNTVFDLEDSFLEEPQMKACIERLKADPDFAKLLSDGYESPDFKLDEMLKYPPGSLGHMYGKLLSVQGFDPHFYRDRPLKTDVDYAIMRVRKTHDLHHVVTGFGQLGGGELGVIGVTAYQYGYPAFALIDLTAIALAFKQAQGFQRAIDLVGQGMKMGHDCKALMGVKWEEGLDKPVDRWRKELNITPITTGPNSYYVSVPAMNDPS